LSSRGEDVPARVVVPVVVMPAVTTVPVKVGDADNTTEPVPVEEVVPVPPLATANVPAKVRVPLVVIGPPVNDSPVVPPDTSTEVTVPEPPTVVQVGVAPAPAEVSTCPDVPTAPLSANGDAVPTKVKVPVVERLAVATVPVNVGLADSTLLPVPVDEVTPVPPLVTASVPLMVIVPDVVIGPPAKVRPVVPPDTLIELTVPTEVHVGVEVPPVEVRT